MDNIAKAIEQLESYLKLAPNAKDAEQVRVGDIERDAGSIFGKKGSGP